MKVHSRNRRVAKWLGAAASVLLLVVWVGSAWIDVAWRNSSWDRVWLSRGCVAFSRGIKTEAANAQIIKSSTDYLNRYRDTEDWMLRNPGAGPKEVVASLDDAREHNVRAVAMKQDGHRVRWVSADFAMWFTFDFTRDPWFVAIPLWTLVLPMLICTVVAWRRDSRPRRRVRAGRCGACDYVREGLAAEAACPECGGVPDVVDVDSTQSA